MTPRMPQTPQSTESPAVTELMEPVVEPETEAGRRLLQRLRTASNGPASRAFREGIAYASEMVAVEEIPAIEREARGVQDEGDRLFLANVQACLRRFGAHKSHCSTLREPGHKICDCGLHYALATYAPQTLLREAQS